MKPKSKPPYTITEKAADYLAKIVETVTRLEFGTIVANSPTCEVE